MIQNFHGRWSIDEQCDFLILESSHPLIENSLDLLQGLIKERFHFTHDCNVNEIAFFKVDINLIEKLPIAYLGKFKSKNFYSAH